ncbi:MerR family transcriptional regulator [Pelagibacterium xiamenense]|uniref:MerR family transcriptional regulator n=1 Tax=Pelagibacterium xiamenense TaxID=2901140 RepID=UPI001E3F9296|nr:helix-turn-helix domain-containing protein [Pelagibacterium xiamenense]MCD7059093.1 helix-turn-helix domain-containing protein [Pelagibacterium xiamenense]
MTQNLSIGAVARETGIRIPTIRYYEQIGLVPEPPRTQGNRRLYDRNTIERLNFVRRSRELGFDIEAIRALLSLQDQPETSCERADTIATERLAEVEKRLARLSALKKELKAMLAECRHGRVAQCRVIEALAS